MNNTSVISYDDFDDGTCYSELLFIENDSEPAAVIQICNIVAVGTPQAENR